jgi:hypothetical protein
VATSSVVAGRHYPTSTGELLAWFPSDADCLDYLEWLRWPKGFGCPAAAISAAGGSLMAGSGVLGAMLVRP